MTAKTRRNRVLRPNTGSSDSHEDEWLTVDEFCRIVKIGRRTFERYMSRGTGPRVKRLAGNGSIRIKRDWLYEWMEEDTA